MEYIWNIHGNFRGQSHRFNKERFQQLIGACDLFTVCYELERLANQGSNFSCTKSGMSSWGQCPTPSSTKSFTFSFRAGNEEKYLPTGPSSGVKGSWSPHKSKTGKDIFGINCTGLGPGGPVTMDTNASNAPGSFAGSLMIYITVSKCQF